jgi:sulfatase maturation enzyme AslB (radical SAM superfamily)
MSKKNENALVQKKVAGPKQGLLINILKKLHQIVVFLIPESSPLYRRLYYLGMRLTLRERLKPMKAIRIHMPLSLHCNLDCKGCCTYSPLASEQFYDIKEFENDVKRLAELTNGTVDRLHLIGGEPLLHPQICDCIAIARKYIKKGEVIIFTNGILLASQPDAFWQACADNNAAINVTRYPLNIDWRPVNEKAAQYSVATKWADFHGKKAKILRKFTLDCSGQHNAKDSFSMCIMANRCPHLMNGKLYTCTTPIFIKFFNSEFNENLQVGDQDYLDIYKVHDMDEVFDWIRKPVPFCRYCATREMQFGIKWERSKRERSEWT